MPQRISHDKSRIGKEKKENKTLRAPDETRNKTQTQVGPLKCRTTLAIARTLRLGWPGWALRAKLAGVEYGQAGKAIRKSCAQIRQENICKNYRKCI